MPGWSGVVDVGAILGLRSPDELVAGATVVGTSSYLYFRAQEKVNKMDPKERNAHIYKMREKKITYQTIANIYGLSTSRVRQIYIKEKHRRVVEHFRQDEMSRKSKTYGFDTALVEAGKELGLEHLVTRTFNCLFRTKIIQSIDTIPLKTYSDKKTIEYKRFRRKEFADS